MVYSAKELIEEDQLGQARCGLFAVYESRVTHNNRLLLAVSLQSSSTCLQNPEGKWHERQGEERDNGSARSG